MPREEEFEGRIRWLTYEEEDRLLSLLERWSKAEHYAYTVFAIDTGMRPSEIYRVSPQYVDKAQGAIAIWKTKNRKPRTIPMTSRVKAIVEAHRGDGLFFPFTLTWYSNVWDRAKESMGLRDDPFFIPYILRHTFASRLIQNGVHLAVIKDLMGHKDLKTTMRYAHLAPANLSNAIAVMEKARGAGEKALADSHNPGILTQQHPVSTHSESGRQATA